MIEGTMIPKPYAYRVLLPWALNLLSYCTNSRSILLFVLLASIFFFLLVFLFAMRQILDLFYRISTPALNLFPVFLAFFLIPFFYGWNSYIYDFPLLLFWALFIVLIKKNRLGTFYLVFLLSCLNKETTILIIPVFFFYFLRNKARIRWLIYHGFLQLVIFAAIRIAILIAMKGHPGRAFEFWLSRNVQMIIRPLSFPMILTFILLLGFLFHDWGHKPLLLRSGIFVLSALIPIMLFVGWINELRDYLEAIPFLAPLCYVSFVRFFEVLKVPLFPEPKNDILT